MSWRSVIRRNLLKIRSAKNDDSNIRYYCKTEEQSDVLETADVNTGHKRTTGKIHYFVCDSQKHSLYLFLSKLLFLSFNHGSWTDKEVLQRHSISDRAFFGTLWTVSIEEKGTDKGISCTSNPFTFHEFSVPGRLDWYAVWTRRILLIHYELLTHWGRVTQICVFTLQLRKTDDANLRF